MNPASSTLLAASPPMRGLAAKSDGGVVVRVRGTDDPTEIAAVVAAVVGAASAASTRPRQTASDGYERWRRQRLAALRATLSEPG